MFIEHLLCAKLFTIHCLIYSSKQLQINLLEIPLKHESTVAHKIYVLYLRYRESDWQSWDKQYPFARIWPPQKPWAVLTQSPHWLWVNSSIMLFVRDTTSLLLLPMPRWYFIRLLKSGLETKCQYRAHKGLNKSTFWRPMSPWYSVTFPFLVINMEMFLEKCKYSIESWTNDLALVI